MKATLTIISLLCIIMISPVSMLFGADFTVIDGVANITWEAPYPVDSTITSYKVFLSSNLLEWQLLTEVLFDAELKADYMYFTNQFIYIAIVSVNADGIISGTTQGQNLVSCDLKIPLLTQPTNTTIQ